MSPLFRFSCIVLSAGDSGRMGTHKALLPFGDEKVTFLEKITRQYANAGIDQIIVVVNSDLYGLLETKRLDLPENLKLVINARPDLGRFHSLKTGLELITRESAVFFQNVDNPFTEQSLIELMSGEFGRADVIIPLFEGRAGHPVLISPLVCSDICGCGNSSERIDHFLRRYTSCAIEANTPGVLSNINTQTDYSIEFPGFWPG